MNQDNFRQIFSYLLLSFGSKCNHTISVGALDLFHKPQIILQFICLILMSPGCASQGCLPKRAQCRIKSFPDDPWAADFAHDKTTVKNVLKDELALKSVS